MCKEQLQFTVQAKSKYADAQSAPQSVEQSTVPAKSKCADTQSVMLSAANKYADIINLPHHKAANRKHMSMLERAAQFSPYAALVGFDGVIAETGRLTDRKIELSEAEKAVLDRKLAALEEVLKNSCGANRSQYSGLPQQHIDLPQHTALPLITVRYFVPDDLKAGGSYQQYTGRLKKIDRVQRVMIFVDEGREKQNGDRHDSEGRHRRTKTIPIDDVLEISGEMLDSIYER